MGWKPLTSGTAIVSAAKIEYRSSHTGNEQEICFVLFFVFHLEMFLCLLILATSLFFSMN